MTANVYLSMYYSQMRKCGIHAIPTFSADGNRHLPRKLAKLVSLLVKRKYAIGGGLSPELTFNIV